MSAILAPTRGGEPSFPNQDLAIQMAKEKGSRLIFLYVSDVRFFRQMHVSYFRELEEDLAGMGEFLLAMAQERAEKAGVTAEAVVRRGYFGRTVRELIQDEGVTMFLMGAPTKETGLTSRDYLDALFKELVNEHGIEVILAEDGAIVERYGPEQPDS